MELNWKNANLWQLEANVKKEVTEPKWSFDCGFKLDFDGGLVTIESRFYPPYKNNHKGWEGILNVMVIGDKVISKVFLCDTLDQLKDEVETYIDHYKGIVKSRLK